MAEKDTAKKIWLIESVEEFGAFRDAVNQGETFEGWTVSLGADIDLADIENWAPIGIDEDHSFRGTFDGNGKTISNLKIDSEENNIGLFGYLSGGVIKNFTLENADVSGRKCVAAVAGNANSGEIKNVTVTGIVNVTGLESVGAVAGQGYVVLSDIIVKVDPDKSFVKGSQGFIGGVMGHCLNGERELSNIESNINIGCVGDGIDEIQAVGGIFGRVGHDITLSNITCRAEFIEAVDISEETIQKLKLLFGEEGKNITKNEPIWSDITELRIDYAGDGDQVVDKVIIVSDDGTFQLRDGERTITGQVVEGYDSNQLTNLIVGTAFGKGYRSPRREIPAKPGEKATLTLGEDALVRVDNVWVGGDYSAENGGNPPQEGAEKVYNLIVDKGQLSASNDHDIRFDGSMLVKNGGIAESANLNIQGVAEVTGEGSRIYAAKLTVAGGTLRQNGASVYVTEGALLKAGDVQVGGDNSFAQIVLKNADFYAQKVSQAVGKGRIMVSGESKLVLDAADGLIELTDVVLADSVIGKAGNGVQLMVTGKDNSVKDSKFDLDTMTVAADTALDMQNVTASANTVDVSGALTADKTYITADKLDVAGKLQFSNAKVKADAFKVTGNAEFFNAGITADTLDNAGFMKLEDTVAEIGEVTNSGMSLNNSKVTAGKFTNSAKVGLEKSQLNIAGKMVNDGEVVINASDSQLAVGGEYSGEGKIIIEASGISTGSFKAVDRNGVAGFNVTKLEDIKNLQDFKVDGVQDGVNVLVRKDGDIILSDAQMSELYVDAAWEGKEFGADLGDGKVFDVNSFYTFNDAAFAQIGETKCIYVRSDVSDKLAGNTYTGTILNGTADNSLVTVSDSLNNDYISFNNISIGENVQFKGKYFYLTGENTVDGEIAASTTFYNSADSVLTVNGKVEAYNVMSRLYDGTENGIYVVGTAAAGEGASADSQFIGRNYIGHYSGTFSVKDTAAEFGYILLGNDTADVGYPQAQLILDNALVKTTGGANTQPGQMLVTNGAAINATNKSVLEIVGPKDFAYLSMKAGTSAYFNDSTLKLGKDGQGTNTLNGTITLKNNSLLTSIGKISNGGTITVDNSALEIGGKLENTGVINVHGASTVDADVSGTGLIDMYAVALDDKTDISGSSNIRFLEGYNTVQGSSITAGTLEVMGSQVVVSENAELAITEKATINSEFAIENSTAEFKVLNVSKDGSMTVSDMKDTFAAESMDVAGKAVFAGTDADITKVSVSGSLAFSKADSLSLDLMDVAAGGSICFADVQAVAAENLTNAGAVKVADSGFTADKVANKGEFTVAGTSTLDIVELTDNAINVAAGTTLVDSTVGGALKAVNGEFTFSGNNTFTKLRVTDDDQNIDTVINVNDGTLTVYNPGFTGDMTFNGNGNIKFLGGTFLQTGKYVINTDMDVDGGALYFTNAVVEINSNVSQKDNNGEIIYINGSDVTVNAGATLSGFIGVYDKGSNQGVLRVEGGKVAATGMYQEGDLILTKKAQVELTGKLTNTGSIVLDQTSSITGGSINSTGTVTVNLNDGFEGVLKLIDVTSGTYAADSITINGTAEYHINDDGDLVVYNGIDTTTVYFNYSWNNKEFGDRVGDGIYFGINAFDKFDVANSLLVLPEDTVTIELATRNTVSYGQLLAGQGGELTVRTNGDDYAVIDNFVNMDNNLTFAENSKVKVTNASAVIGGDYNTVTVNGELYFTTGSLAVDEEGKLVVNGLLKAGDNAFSNAGTVEVSGTMELGDAPVLAGKLTVDGGKLSVDGDVANEGEFKAVNYAEISTGDFTNGGTVSFDNAEVNTGKFINDEIVAVSNGSVVTTKDFINNGKVTVNDSFVTTEDFSNYDKVTVDGSTLTVETLTNEGTIEFAGETTLYNDAFTGKAVSLKEGLVLDGDMVLGTVNVDGDAEIAGEMTAAKLNVVGNDLTVTGNVDATEKVLVTNGDMYISEGGSVSSEEITFGAVVTLSGFKPAAEDRYVPVAFIPQNDNSDGDTLQIFVPAGATEVVVNLPVLADGHYDVTVVDPGNIYKLIPIDVLHGNLFLANGSIKATAIDFGYSAVEMDALSSIEADTITINKGDDASASIAISVRDHLDAVRTEDALDDAVWAEKLINIKGSGDLFTEFITIDGVAFDGNEINYGDYSIAQYGNDLYLIGATREVLYIGTEYNVAAGSVVKNNVAGFNGFTYLDAAPAGAPALNDNGRGNGFNKFGTTKEIVFSTGNTVSYGNLYVDQDLTISSVGEGEVILGEFDIDSTSTASNTVTVAEGSRFRFTEGGQYGTALNANDTIIVNGSLTFDVSVNVYAKSTITVNKTGSLIFASYAMQNTVNPLTVYGKLVIGDKNEDTSAWNGWATGSYAKLVGNENNSGSLFVDGGSVEIYAPAFSIGGGFASSWVDGGAEAILTMTDAKLESNAWMFRIGKGGVVSLDNSTFEIQDNSKYSAMKVLGSGDTAYASGNDGVITLTDSVFDISKLQTVFTNTGSISVADSDFAANELDNSNEITVTGNSLVKINDFKGEIVFENADIKSGSLIGGVGGYETPDFVKFAGEKVSVNGNVEIGPRIDVYSDVEVKDGATLNGTWICLYDESKTFTLANNASVNCSTFWSSVSAPAYAQINGTLEATDKVYLHNADIYGKLIAGKQLLVYSNDAFNVYGEVEIKCTTAQTGWLIGNPGSSAGAYAGEVTVNVSGGSVSVAGNDNGVEISIADNGVLNINSNGSVKVLKGIISNKGELNIDSGSLSTNYQLVNTGTMDWKDAMVDIASGTIENNNTISIASESEVTAGTVKNNGDLLVDNSTVSVNKVINAGTLDIINGSVFTAAAIESTGDLTVTGATLDADKVTGDLTVGGESSIEAVVAGKLTFADDIALTDDSVISVNGSVEALGDLTLSTGGMLTVDGTVTVEGDLSIASGALSVNNAVTVNGDLTMSGTTFGATTLTVNGDMYINDVDTTGTKNITVYTGALDLAGSLIINGYAVDEMNRIVLGDFLYKVNVNADSVTLTRPDVSYTDISVSITDITQADGKYVFTIDAAVEHGYKGYTYAISVTDKNGNVLATESTGLEFALTGTLATEIYVTLTVFDKYGYATDVTTAPYKVTVTDCSGPEFLAGPVASIDGDQLVLDWTAFDPWGIKDYIVTINGETFNTGFNFEKVSLSRPVVNGRNTYTVVAIDSNGFKTEYSGVLVTANPAASISGNGVSQIIGFDAARGAVGYIANEGTVSPEWKGIWEWGADTTMSVVGVGNFDGSAVDHSGLLCLDTSTGALSAWTNINDPSYGYVDLGNIGIGSDIKAFANLDGNNFDDVLFVKADGSIGVLTDAKDYVGITEGDAVELIGAGTFGDGLDSLVVKKDGAFYLMSTDNVASGNWTDSKIMDSENQQLLDVIGNWKITAIGDFQGDGIDDILMTDEDGKSFILNDGKTDSIQWAGQITDDFEVAGVGDYNGNGKEDLLLREVYSGWGGLGYWESGYAGNWVDLNARIETSDDPGHSGKFVVVSKIS